MKPETLDFFILDIPHSQTNFSYDTVNIVKLLHINILVDLFQEVFII